MNEKGFAISSRPIFQVREVLLGVEHGWRLLDKFVHTKCGQPALLHPDSNQVWACAQCELVTDSPSVFFKQVA
jgi:hypothetical protein